MKRFNYSRNRNRTNKLSLDSIFCFVFSIQSDCCRRQCQVICYLLLRFSFHTCVLDEKESYDLYQIAILIDQLKSDDITSRINAHKSIARIGMPY